MAISDEDIQRVREANDLVEVIGERTPVKQRGRDYWCCCPFHEERTPSCKIDPSTQLWHCFGCHEGGDLFSFVMKIDDVGFMDAVRWLANRANVDIHETQGGGSGSSSSEKARLKEICSSTADFYHSQLMRSPSGDAAAARSYLGGRGLGGVVPKEWHLGFAPGRGALVQHLRAKGFKPAEMVKANVAVQRDNGQVADRFYNRVMFPIHDVRGDTIAFGGRVIGKGEPKYLNSQETPIFHKSQVLFGLDKAKGSITAKGEALVVEGYTDVIALHMAGITNAVATLGTALTIQHIRELSRYAKNRIVYLFDGDEAGQRAADRALQFIDMSMTPESGRKQVELYAITLPDNQDPADFVGNFGPAAMEEQLKTAVPLIQFGINRHLAKYDLTRAEQRSAAARDALSILAPIKESILAKDYAIQIAGMCRMREEDALQALSKLQPPKRYDANDSSRKREGKSGAAHAGTGAGTGTRVGTGTGAGVGAGAGAAGYASDGGYDDYDRVPYDDMAASYDSDADPDALYAAPARELTPQESNRITMERELLCVLAKNPGLALVHAQSLAQIDWHSDLYRSISDAMLDILAASPQVDSASLVTSVASAVPSAYRVLTASGMDFAPGIQAETMTQEQLATFLVEEIAIGDQEEAIANLKVQMKMVPPGNHEEYDYLFQTVSMLQAQLRESQRRHGTL